MSGKAGPLVGIIMGSKGDFEHLKPACELLDELKIPYEATVSSAHRNPDQTAQWSAGAQGRGLKVIIAGAGGAAALPGVVAAKTLLPVLGVPIPSTSLGGMDSLLSIVQMPKGVAVGTLAIGKPGAANAALLAAEIIALGDVELRGRLAAWREARSREVEQLP